jgi:hypothetical protein
MEQAKPSKSALVNKVLDIVQDSYAKFGGLTESHIRWAMMYVMALLNIRQVKVGIQPYTNPRILFLEPIFDNPLSTEDWEALSKEKQFLLHSKQIQSVFKQENCDYEVFIVDSLPEVEVVPKEEGADE